MALKDSAMPMTKDVSKDMSSICNTAFNSRLTQACRRLWLASGALDPNSEPAGFWSSELR